MKRKKVLAIVIGVVFLYAISVIAVGSISYFRGVEVPTEPFAEPKPEWADELEVGGKILDYSPREYVATRHYASAHFPPSPLANLPGSAESGPQLGQQ